MKFKKLLVLSVMMLTGVSVWAAELIERKAPTAPESAVIDAAALEAIEKVAVKFEVGKYYVLYNTGAQQYYSQGNNWGTRASVSDLPILVRFTLPEGKTLADNALLLNDYCLYNKAWKLSFFDTATSIFVDRGSQANYYWQVLDQGNNIYRLQASEANPTLKPSTNPGFVGRDPNVAQDNSNNEGSRNVNVENTFPISPFLAEGAGYIDWVFYNGPAEWNAYGESLDLYNKSVTLKSEIASAEKMGIDVAAAAAVYNNESATIAQMQEQIDALLTAKKNSVNTASGADPKDASFYLVNPTFDTIGDFHGWSGTAFGAGGTTSTNAEWYEKDKDADAFQDVTGLAAGYYVVGAKGFYRAGNTETSYTNFKNNSDALKSIVLYATVGETTNETIVQPNFKGVPTEDPQIDGQASAKDSETGVTYYVPNTMKSAEVFMHKLGLYDNFVFAKVGEGETLRVGVKKPGAKIGSDWAIFDDFSLTFVGANEGDLYAGMAWKLLQNYPTYENVLATNSVFEAYQLAKTNDTERATVQDQAAFDAFMAKVDAAKAALDENIALWKQWSAVVATLTESYKAHRDEVNDKTLKNDVMDYIEDEPDEDFICRATELKTAQALTNAELEKEIKDVQALLDAFELAAKGSIAPGTDITNYLTNPAFDDTYRKATGWTIEAANGGSVQCRGSESATEKDADGNPKVINQGFEAWNNANFDIYQTVTNVPVGIYEISVQGFYRYDGGEKAWDAYNAQSVEYVKPGKAPVYVYLNDKKTPFKNVYEEESQDKDFYIDCAQKDDEGNPKESNGSYQWKGIWSGDVQNVPADAPTAWYPNDMISGAIAFSAGLYTQSAFSLVAKTGDVLRLGVKGTSNQVNNSWCIFDNFKLTYRGMEITYVKPVLGEAIANAESDLTDPETGLVKPLGKDAFEALYAALGEAQKAYEGTDGDVMFEKLAALVGVDIAASQAKFDSLYAKANELQTAYMAANDDMSSSRPAESALEAALQLANQIFVGIENRELTDADANDLMKKVDEAIAALKIPAAMDTASDDNPIDVTKFINNADYSSNTNDGWTTGATVARGGDKLLSEAYWDNSTNSSANKSFDYYQDIEGLPVGTYEVSVQGFYRYGNAVNEDTLYTQKPEENNNLSLYVKVGEGNAAAQLMPRLASQGVEEYTSTVMEATAKEDGTYNFVAGADLENEGDRWQWTWCATPVASADSTSATGRRICNGLAVSSLLFDAEKFLGTTVTFKVENVGDKVRIGLKKSEDIPSSWCVWDNWKLTFYGANSAKEVTPVGIAAIAGNGAQVVKTELYSVSGARVKAGRGLVIVKQTMSDGSVQVKKMLK